MINRHRQQWISALGLFMLSLDAGFAVAQSPQRVASAKVLGTVDLAQFDPKKKPTFWISPDGRRVAWMTEKGIVIDGQAKDYAYGVEPERFSFSPDSKHAAYVARTTGQGGRNEVVVLDGKEVSKFYNGVRFGPLFSPDSQHYACICRLSASSFASVLLVDGREGTEQHDSFAWELTFTPDSKRVVYGVKLGEDYRMREENLDGTGREERKHSPAVLTGNFFYGSAGQVGYIASEGDKSFVFYDGKDDGQRFKGIKQIVKSADGKQIAYIAEPASFADQAVIGGKPGKVYSGQGGDIKDNSLELSPDGRRYGYSIKNFSKHQVIIDGQLGKVYPNVGGPIFSPDSKRYAYQAANNGKLIIVVDGQESAGYDDLGMPEFSPDSKSVAYYAETGGKQFMVLNGQKQKTYDSVGSPVFSPDSKRLLYLAETGGKWLLVENGKEGMPYDDIGGRIYFSKGGQRVATVFGQGDRQFVVVDGVQGTAYDTIVSDFGGKLHWTAPHRLHYLATKGDQLLLVEETIQ